jgi:addiction module HigA family antidote
MKKVICEWNIHPGVVLKEEIEYRGISKKELAKKLNISYKALNDILNERSPITADIARGIEVHLGIDAEFFIGFQYDYDIRSVKEEREAREKKAKEEMKAKAKKQSKPVLGLQKPVATM